MVIGSLLASPWSVWGIAGLATAAVITRPFSWPEFIWAVAGASLLVALGMLTPREAWSGIVKGTDVYLFLTGMMLMSELARQEGLFDWLAAWAAVHAKGSATRLFSLVFGVGTVVTVFLSNDATAVVLTPAVAAVVKAANAKKPLPYLLICAFIANAASFVLPISNPANLVIYGSHMPPLAQWLPRYGLASVLSIEATYVVLRWAQRGQLRQEVSGAIDVPVLTRAGKLAALGIAMTAIVLLLASGFDMRQAVQQSATGAAWVSGGLLAVGCNLVNNLPAGLLAGRVVDLAQVPDRVRSAVLIGVDLGPNLSVTGSLATILWLSALRREGQTVSAWTFLKLGVLVMPPALLLALAGAFAFG